MQQTTCDSDALFDQLIGAAAQGQRYRQTECCGALEVDEQVYPGDLLDRQVGGLLAFENPADVEAGNAR
jgi:hypothetical protein